MSARPQRRPADVGRSTSILTTWTVAGVVLAPVVLGAVAGVPGFHAGLVVVIAGGVFGVRHSNLVSDSDRWQADDARRRRVATPEQLRRLRGR